MNNRQKAKHWRKLYEQQLPKKPYPVVYQHILPTHYRLEYLIDPRELYSSINDQQLIKTHIENEMMRKLRPLVWDHLKAQQDIYKGMIRYSLDVWMEEVEQ